MSNKINYTLHVGPLTKSRVHYIARIEGQLCSQAVLSSFAFISSPEPKAHKASL